MCDFMSFNFSLQVDLRFSAPAIKAIAAKALSRRTGARGLRSILEQLLLDSMFETPGSPISAVHIDEDCVAGKKHADYIMIPVVNSVESNVEEDLKDDDDVDESARGRASNWKKKTFYFFL